MSTLPPWNAWWPWVGVLAIEVAFVIGAATLLHRWITSAWWRRTIWQSVILGLIALVALEVTGTPRRLLDSGHKRAEATPLSGRPETRIAPLPIQVTEDRSRPAALRPFVPVRPAAARPSPAPPGSHWVARLSLLWLMGAVLLLLRCVLARLAFTLFRGRTVSVTDMHLQARVHSLALRLRLRRPVRLLESRRIKAPMAFGLVRPAIGLPLQFAAHHSPAQKDVMLAHELAHLAAGDAFWYLLAEITTAMLWWHPLAWWARRQLHAATEAAADEASLLIDDGPKVLAACLIELANRMASVRPLSGMGIHGFRSGLGRRVHRLLHLAEKPWSPPGWFGSNLAKTLGPATLVIGVILCTAWTVPQSSSNGAIMKWQNWKQTLGTFALTAAVVNGDASAAEAARPSDKPSAPAAEPNTTPDQIAWQNWNPPAVAKARSEGRPILVNFAADWCMTCQANNKTSLEISSVRQRLKIIQAAAFLADYTRANDLIAGELKKFGREGVPLVLVYPNDASAEPLVLPALLTEQIVLDALQYAVIPQEEFITPAIRPLVEAARQGNPKAKRQDAFGGGGGFGGGGFGGFGGSGGAREVGRKLETIRLDEVQFDALPLGNVVDQLIQESTKRDPAKRGVNFLFDQSTGTLTPAINPATGLPEPRTGESVDVRAVTVRIVPALKNVRLLDVLDAITRVADPPVKYSIEDYAVVFSAAAPPTGVAVTASTLPTNAPLVVRTFTINADTIETAAARALGMKLIPNSSDQFVGDLRNILAVLGVNMDTPKKALFYNDLTRILMVRATADDLLVVEALLEMLGSGTDRPSRTSAAAPKATAGAEEAIAKLIQALSKSVPEVRK